MDKGLKHSLATALFWGAVWGIAEATLGYLTHLIPMTGFAGFVMFPIGFIFLWKGYKADKRVQTLLMIGVIAASVKMVNLFFPGLNFNRTINPALSILMETLVVVMAVKIFDSSKMTHKIATSAAVSFAWRGIYLLYHLVLFRFTNMPTLFHDGASAVAKFVVVDSLINTILIFGFINLDEKLKSEQFKWITAKSGVVISSVLLAAAVFAEYVLYRV